MEDYSYNGDYKQILDQLKHEDEMVVYEAVLNLQGQLAVAQENTLSNFMLDQYIPALIDVFKRPVMTDISNEINMYAIQSLINLMDIFPSICNSVVNHGGVQALNLAMQGSMGFTDLSEACIKAFEKISQENPYAILTSKSLAFCLDMMDFFEINTQKRILILLMNCSRHSATEEDFDENVAPTLPTLCLMINMRNENQLGMVEKLETISSTLLKVAESFSRFFSAQSQFARIQAQYTKLQNHGLIESVAQALQEYSIMDQALKSSLGGSPEKGNQRSLNVATIQNFLKFLSLSVRCSFAVCKQLTEQDVFKVIDGFIPSQEDLKRQHFSQDQFPFIIDSITLLDCLFPDKESIPVKEEGDKGKSKLESEKKDYFSNYEQPKVAYVIEKILPKIFSVFENNMNQMLRTKTLQVIDKTLQLSSNELLNNFIEPYSFAKFIFSNFQSHNIAQIQICLEMVNKLMQTNPRTYTMPLLREGIAEFVKKISTEDGFEKTLDVKMDQILKEKSQQLKDFEAIIQAKTQILKTQQEQTQDEEQKKQFEITIQQYLDAAKEKSSALGVSLKPQIEINKSIVALAKTLCETFFNNEGFLAEMKEHCAEEFQLFNDMKVLSQKIMEEASCPHYNEDQFKDLMAKLVKCLSNNRRIMTYEFRESGLLHALECLLTRTPKEVHSMILQEKAKESGEEMKQSDNQMLEEAKKSKSLSKKEARAYLQRLRIFFHQILKVANGKQVINELVQLCHELISQGEQELFELQKESAQSQSSYYGMFGQGGQDFNASVSALKHLSKKLRVNLVYDPQKKQLKQETEEKIKPQTNSSKDLAFEAIPAMAKSSSQHPALNLIGDQATHQSKVFMKRDSLYNELKSVLLGVEQCHSLSLLEDFLRNKIRTKSDVKALKTPSFYDSLQKNQRSQKAKAVMDSTMSKLRDILSQSNRDKADGDEYAVLLADEIFNSKDLNDEEQLEVIRQMEIQSIQMMESIYNGEESPMGDEGRDGSFEEWLQQREMGRGNNEEEMDQEQRAYEFHRTIEKIKQLYKDRQVMKKKEDLMIKFGKKEEPVLLKKEAVKVEQQIAQMAPVEVQEVKQEKIDEQMKGFEQEEEKKGEKENLKKSFTNQEMTIEEGGLKIAMGEGEDIIMTDEEEEERRAKKNELEKMTQMMKKQVEKQHDLQPGEMDQESMEQELDELINSNGEDIEYEFFVPGYSLAHNQTIFEVMKMVQSPAKAPQIKSYYTSYTANQDATLTIYFSIRDVEQSQVEGEQRKDSYFEYNVKRVRSLSEVVDDTSMSAVNSLVKQLMEKEFQVFSRQPTDQEHTLEYALRVLKVLYFLCKNTNLVSSQGIKFLMKNALQEDQEQEGFSDYDLQVSLSQIHPSLFHHHKLDMYIVKNIQDPYNIMGGGITDSLQQIFRSCPFLFPFHTRILFFKLVSFIGSIDMNRSIYFLKHFLKGKVGKVPQQDEKTFKIQKQKVVVDRTKLLECSFNLLKNINKRAFLEVEFKDEVGTGLGPTLEFYNLLSEELKVRKKEVWRPTMPDNCLFPAPISPTSNEDSQKVYELFRLAGTMVAKCLVDDRLFDLPISPLFWDIVLGKKMNLFDMERLDQEQFKVFSELQLLANKKRTIDKEPTFDFEAQQRQINLLRTSQNVRVEDLTLFFVLPGNDKIELKANGAETEVTIYNLQEYIDLVMSFTFHDTIRIQVAAFKRGFNSIFPIESLKAFSSAGELEEMICGANVNDDEWTNVQALSEFIIPAHGYHHKSHEYLDFLKFLTTLNKDERKKFLKFATGSSRLPRGGFEALDPKMSVVYKRPVDQSVSPDTILPSVMTCQNFLKLPSYSSFEVLKSRFETAYNEGSNNFTLS